MNQAIGQFKDRLYGLYQSLSFNSFHHYGRLHKSRVLQDPGFDLFPPGYKKDLGERKINIDDDYIKFIRFAEHFIEKNKSGIVAMITNNSFIDGITHRQMRKHLLGTFDVIYILDLHGNSKKKEKAPDGGKDENVFEIRQGVAIALFIKRKDKDKKGCKVYHKDLYGLREVKYDWLFEHDFDKKSYTKIKPQTPWYFFIARNTENIQNYLVQFNLKIFSQSLLQCNLKLYACFMFLNISEHQFSLWKIVQNIL